MRDLNLLLLLLVIPINAFSTFHSIARGLPWTSLARGGDLSRLSRSSYQAAATIGSDEELAKLTDSEAKVRSFLRDLHESQNSFRIVVIGNGAILETTNILGPQMNLSASPKTGEPLITMASEDQSFEFHVKIAQVSKISLVEVPKDNKTLQLFRLANQDGGPMCSLILLNTGGDSSWFNGMKSKYGDEIEL